MSTAVIAGISAAIGYLILFAALDYGFAWARQRDRRDILQTFE
jgi:hypothetical protein